MLCLHSIHACGQLWLSIITMTILVVIAIVIQNINTTTIGQRLKLYSDVMIYVTKEHTNTGANQLACVDISTRRKYELSPPFSYDVTQVTRASVIHNLVEISTPASRFAPVTKGSKPFQLGLYQSNIELTTSLNPLAIRDPVA